MMICSILLVDDNLIDLDLTKRAFDRCNLCNPLLVAHDAEEVMELMQRWESGEPAPDLVLLDLNLPKVNGLEILRRLKNHRQFKAIPVIMLTSSDEDRDIHAAYHLGANSYIVKPVDFDRLLELVAQIAGYWCRVNILPKTA